MSKRLRTYAALVSALGLIVLGGCAHDPDASVATEGDAVTAAPAVESAPMAESTPAPAAESAPSGETPPAPAVVEATPLPHDGAVEDAVRVQTEDIRPADVPAEVAGPEVVDGAAPVLPTEEQILQQYKIGPSDVLQFRSFDDNTLDTTVTVRHDGYISLPWIPDLKVGGLTREEATNVVREAYQELYFEAEVSLQITEATSQSFTVTGDVTRPGAFPYLKPINLLDAIVAAGSLRVNQRGGDSFVGGQGQLVKAIIIRGEGESRTPMEYDLRNLDKAGSHATQTPVLPGDTVFIPEGLNLVYILGAVGRPGIQPLTENMTLLQVMAASGGFNESGGRLKQVVLMREVSDKETEVRLINVKEILRNGGDFPMMPGDILYVPRKRLVTLGEFISRSTQLVSPIMGVTSQAMGLYTQAYDVFYANERIDLLYNSDNVSQSQTNLQLLEAIRNIGEVADGLGGSN